jgi:tRNA pseudouridine55 synthase
MGLSLINKPSGLGSHDLVALVRKTLNIKRVGHIGTLDPMAEGLMGILIGRATLLSPYLILEDKEYSGEIILGLKTDSDDITGKAVEDGRERAPLEIGTILEAAKELMGVKPQIPPSFSAISKGGERSYKRARRGESFSLPPRMVELKSFSVEDYSPPVLSFKARVSKGFYIRALARDLGLLMGLPGGALKSLKRLSLGPFTLEVAITPPFSPEELYLSLIPPEGALPFLAEYPLNPKETELIRRGGRIPFNPKLLKAQAILPPNPIPQAPIKLIAPESGLIALGRVSFEAPYEKERRAFPKTDVAGASHENPFKNHEPREISGFPKAGEAKAVDFSLSSRYKSEAPETNNASGMALGGSPLRHSVGTKAPGLGPDGIAPNSGPNASPNLAQEEANASSNSLNPALSPKRDHLTTPKEPFLRPLRVL